MGKIQELRVRVVAAVVKPLTKQIRERRSLCQNQKHLITTRKRAVMPTIGKHHAQTTIIQLRAGKSPIHRLLEENNVTSAKVNKNYTLQPPCLELKIIL